MKILPIRSGMLCAALMAATTAAQATESRLSVSGRILPGTCSLIIAGGGLALNPLPFSALGSTALNLGPVKIPASVRCPAPTKVLLRFHDNAMPWGERPYFMIVNRRNPAQVLGNYQVSLVDAGNGTTGERFVLYRTPFMVEHSPIAHANAISSQGMGPLLERRVTHLPFNLQIFSRIESRNHFHPGDQSELYGAMSVSLVYL